MAYKHFARAMSAALLASAIAIPGTASAQQITRIVAFGDSYADNGNAFRLGYSNPAALQVYPTGRFSGGSNYIDTLGTILNAPIENFAIGGAFGGTNSGTLCYDSYYAPGTSPLCGKGLQYQVDQFLNVGTQSAVFPAGNTTLTRQDLVAVSIGGNDARFYQQAGGTLANAATAGAQAAGGTATQLSRLVAQGTPTISFLALNGAVAPEVANNPTAQQIRGVYATSYYNSLQNSLAGFAAKGSIVHYLDGQLLLQNIAANPTAYGINKGLVCPIFPDTTCVVNSSGYLFYGDALHLTSQGFALVGRYVAAQLAGPLTLQAPGQLELDTAKQWGRTLASRSDLTRGSAQPGFSLYVLGDSQQHDVRSTGSNAPFEVRGSGVTVGAEYGMAGTSFGVAANYSRPRVRFGQGIARDNDRSLQLGAYGTATFAGGFVQGQIGFGRDRNRINRTGVLTDLTARPDGTHTTAGLKAGYLVPLVGLRAGPILGVDYAHAKVDSYTETGDPALTLNVSSQSLKSTTGRAGVELRGDLAQLHMFVDGSVEHEFSGDARAITFAQTSAPTIVNHWSIARNRDTYGRVEIGARVAIVPNVGIDVAGSTSLGRNGGNDAGGQVGLHAAF